jgi:hypothetical protein
MAYLGNNLQVAYPSYRTIDDISSQFNGVLKTFALQIGGVAAVPFPINPQQCLISVNGVIQKPDSTGTTGFTLTGTNIVFASAPSAGWAFFGTVLAGADYVNVGANFPSGTAAVPSVTFDQSTSTGLYLVSSNVLGIATSGVQQLTVDSSGNVGITGSVSSAAGTAAAPAYRFTGDTNTGLYSPGADQVGITTGGTVRLTTTTTGITSALPVDVPLGAVGTPSITFTGDLNTGIYSPAADTLAFVEGGVEAMRIDSSGRLGIGTSTVDQLLHLKAANPVLEVEGTASSSGDTGIHFKANANEWFVRADNSTGTNTFSIKSGSPASSTHRFLIDSSGRCGIGTTSPNALFQASGATAPILRVTDTRNTVNLDLQPANTEAYFGTQSNHPLAFQTNATERGRFDASGRLLVGTTSGSGKLTVSGNAIGTTVALTDAATVATDLSLANYYTLTLGGNRTLGAPTNQTAGQSGVIVITQDGTGSRTLAYNSVWKFPNGTVPTLTTTANAVDVLCYYVESGTRITARLLSDVK